MRRYLSGLTFLWLNFIGYIPSHLLRILFYRIAGMRIGRNSYIYAGAEIRDPHQITIGDNVIIGHHAILDGRKGLVIGNNVNLSTGVWIWTMQHDPNSTTFASDGGEVIIEDYAWLSCRTIILPGVTISKGSVIAAGAVVTKSTESFSINGGIPAHKLGNRVTNLNYSLGDAPPIPFI